MSRVIAVTGIKRSGSTWMFNVARLAHEISGVEVWKGGPAKAGLDAIGDLFYDVYVVKEHQWKPELYMEADYILTSVRDHEEIRRSMKQFRGVEVAEMTMDAWFLDMHRWRVRSDYHMRFEDLESDPRKECWKIIEALDLDPDILTTHVMDELQSAMRPPDDARQDPDSLVFEDHYTSRKPEEIIEQHQP